MSDLKKFIQQLELTQDNHSFSFHEYWSTELESDGPESFINYKGIQSFAGDLPANRREDVLNSMLLAQRGATKQFPDEAHILQWHHKYFAILTRLGWTFDSQDFQNYEFKGNIVELEKSILEIIGAALTGNQLAIIKSALSALKSLGEDDKRLIAFETNTHTDQKGSFQLGFAFEENGELAISSSAFILSTTKKLRRILLFSLESESARLQYRTIKATLNEAVFEKGREELRKKLFDSGNFIASLEI